MSGETSWDALGLIFGGEGGIRTRGGLLTHTRFPGVRLKPLIHLSVEPTIVARHCARSWPGCCACTIFMAELMRAETSVMLLGTTSVVRAWLASWL